MRRNWGRRITLGLGFRLRHWPSKAVGLHHPLDRTRAGRGDEAASTASSLVLPTHSLSIRRSSMSTGQSSMLSPLASASIEKPSCRDSVREWADDRSDVPDAHALTLVSSPVPDLRPLTRVSSLSPTISQR